MKLLHKKDLLRLEYFGIELEVPFWASWIAVDYQGRVWIFADKPVKGFGNSSYMPPLGSRYDKIAIVDLEGMNWEDTLVKV